MPRYADWMRRTDTEGVDPYVIDEAKRLLGFVRMRADSIGPKATFSLRRELADGTVITAAYIGGIPSIQIEPVTIPPIVEIKLNNKLWIPRGFVVYPSTTAVFKGWGVPVIQADSSQPWDDTNLAPGLSTDRWTESGPLGEVLISQDLEAGYQSKATPSAPLFYDEADVTRTIAGAYRAPRTGAWAGFRPEFLGYSGSPEFSREFFTYTNTQRSGDPLTPPFRGYFEDGLYLAQHAPTTVLDGQDPTLPAGDRGYSDPAARRNKDGGLAEHSTDAVASFPPTPEDAASQIDGYIGLFGTTFKSNTQLDVAAQGNVVGAALAVRDQWIRYGNHCWRPLDTTLPILSWDGENGTILPFYVQTSAFFLDGDGHLQPVNVLMMDGYPTYAIHELSDVTAELRARDAMPLYSKNLYARGRVLGVLPGFVVAAAIKVSSTSDRLMVMTWHQEDQDVFIPDSPTFENPPEPHIFRTLRLYFCDIKPRHGLRLDPEHMLVDDDWTLAGNVQVTDFGGPDTYPTQFARQAPVFSPDATKFAVVQGIYSNPDDGVVDLFDHRISEFFIGDVSEGSFTYTTAISLPPGDGGFNQQSYEAVDYDSNNARQAIVSVLQAWPYDDFFPEYSGSTVDIRILAREDLTGQQPYQTPDSAINPQCRPEYFGSFIILDVVDFVTVGVYLTGDCFSMGAYSARLLVHRNGTRIHDQIYDQDSSNRVYGESGQGRWYGASYAKNQTGDWIITAEHGAWNGATLVRDDVGSVIIATADSRVAGYVGSSLPDINALVGVDDSSLSLVPAGVV